MGELSFLLDLVKASAPAGVLVVVIWRLLQHHAQHIENLTSQQARLIELITESINHNSYILSRIERALDEKK